MSSTNPAFDGIKSLYQKAKKNPYVIGGVGITSAALFATSAFAIQAPEADSFAYTLYDVGVNQVLNGAPGFIGGLLGVVWSAVNMAKNWMLSTLGILGSTAVIQADAITTSLGMIV